MKNTLIILMLLLSHIAFAGNNKVDKTKEAKAKEWIKNQPLEFIENKGQFMRTDGNAADEVLFKTSFGGCDIYITDKGLSYVFVKMEEVEQSEIPKAERFGNGRVEKGLHKQKLGEREGEENKSISYYRLDMNLEGASISKSNIIKENESKQGHYNYFYAHCPEGIYDVKAYSKITIKNIYNGIDWVIYTNSNSKEHPLKYDFIIHPQADYKDIKIKFLNAQSTSLSDNNTKLKIETIAGNIEEGNLFSYQANSNNEISSKYIIDKDSTISFEISNYDTTKTLVIDPLVWATYYGGSDIDYFRAISTDNQNNIYISGYLISTDFPILQLTGAYWQAINAGNIYNGSNILILKFNNQGVRQWATYYGGSGGDLGGYMSIDYQDNIYICGSTFSIDFPLQQLIGAYWQSNKSSCEIFILKFNNQGVRQWATFYGGISSESANAIHSDSQGYIYITGWSSSLDFPTQQLAGAYWQANMASVNINGFDAFILKFNNLGVRQWATFYGGNWEDEGRSISTDSFDNLYITGTTFSTNFPIQQLAGAYWQSIKGGSVDIFILKFNNLGVRQWATYYGGSDYDMGNAICTDHLNNLYFVGGTYSQNFPTQQMTGAYWQSNNGGGCDIFILKFNNQCVRQWATYYGGNNNDGMDFNTYNLIHSDTLDNIYIVGKTSSTNFPTQQLIGEYWQPNLSGAYDAFILNFNKNCIRQWATYYGANSKANGNGLTVDKNNNIYFIGEWDSIGAYTINPSNGAYYDNSWNGKADGFILKLKSPCYISKPLFLTSNRNSVCANDNGYITLTAIGGMGDTLIWYAGGCGQTYVGKNTSITIPSPTQTTTFYARWESECDTSECDSITINVIQTNISNLNFSICQGDSVLIGQHIYKNSGNYIDTLSNLYGCDSIVKTNLYVIPQKTTNLNPTICDGDTYNVGNYSYSSTGIYSDTLISISGCDSIVTTNLTVNPLPIIDLGLDNEICNGETIELIINQGYTSYLWQDGSTNNNFIVQQPGLYWVIVNQNNCFKSDTVKYIKCRKPIDVWIPNAFTPTGDGLNEVFKIETTGDISKFEMLIFNRWGQLIFESNNSTMGWDGKYQGKGVQAGVYTYRIYINDGNNNQDKTYTGRVTLIR